MKAVNSYEHFFVEAEDGLRDAQESRGLGDVYRDRSTMFMCRLRPKAVSECGSTSTISLKGDTIKRVLRFELYETLMEKTLLCNGSTGTDSRPILECFRWLS